MNGWIFFAPWSYITHLTANLLLEHNHMAPLQLPCKWKYCHWSATPTHLRLMMLGCWRENGQEHTQQITSKIVAQFNHYLLDPGYGFVILIEGSNVPFGVNVKGHSCLSGPRVLGLFARSYRFNTCWWNVFTLSWKKYFVEPRLIGLSRSVPFIADHKNEHSQFILCNLQPTRDQPVRSVAYPPPVLNTAHVYFSLSSMLESVMGVVHHGMLTRMRVCTWMGPSPKFGCLKSRSLLRKLWTPQKYGVSFEMK